MSVCLTLKTPLAAGRIYELRTLLPGAEPAVAYYTMNALPAVSSGRGGG